MDYKKVIKNRAIRIKIMQAMSFVPDKWMVSLQYKIKTGRKLNLKNPRRFTEKLQWYKIFYRDPMMKQCVDKYEVRKYVEKCGLASILNECYGVYNSPDEIDFFNMPNSFVLKDTLGGGGSSVILVPDKKDLNKEQVKRQMAQWVAESTGVKHPGREWVYDGMPHRIIAEKYISSNQETGGLVDYKFFCFGGKFEYLYVIADRVLGQGAGFGIYDCTYHKLDVVRCDEQPLKRDVPKPEAFDEMVEIAEMLARPFPEVRVDLFYQDGEIYFGEMTFFDGSGYMKFDPDEFDFQLGGFFQLPQNIKT